MRVENNVSFKGRIENQINSKNEFVRYSINYLKHYVGGRNVGHKLVFNEAENDIMVFTRLFPIGNAHDICSFTTIKRIDLTSKEQITKQAKELSSWVKRIQNQ